MTKEQAMVREFHQRFGLVAPDRPDLEQFPGDLRVRLIQEEADEFAEAVRRGDVVEMIDALCDLLYVTYGAGVSLGVDLEPFFVAVHQSNLTKIGGRRRDDGKWLKPDGWQPPKLRELFEERYGQGGERKQRV